MKNAKEIGTVTEGVVEDDLTVAKLTASVVVIVDTNIKIAKLVGSVVCEMRDEGFVVVACC